MRLRNIDAKHYSYGKSWITPATNFDYGIGSIDLIVDVKLEFDHLAFELFMYQFSNQVRHFETDGDILFNDSKFYMLWQTYQPKLQILTISDALDLVTLKAIQFASILKTFPFLQQLRFDGYIDTENVADVAVLDFSIPTMQHLTKFDTFESINDSIVIEFLQNCPNLCHLRFIHEMNGIKMKFESYCSCCATVHNF